MNAPDESIEALMDDGTPAEFENPHGVVERRYDSGDGSPSEAVVYAVAEAVNVDPLELDPLHGTVDPDALDALFRNGDDSTLLSFSYGGCDVSVSGQGRVVAAPQQ
ncbi:HalOD1 output domain-containing protein [Halostella litorea]|uniref:HalOD1 output domain-containing protein n=1 Tax=Halostella litorea TaxID=2528831 RepID=UPI00192A20E1|nr:HalOD1 output domain-containing protein [Halostella litorea]